MYESYCDSCHGLNGKGAGPAAVALEVRPTDLTKLAHHNDGEFPATTVLSALGQARSSHGGAEMPVWGEVFRQSGQGETTVRLRLYNLTKYIESIQDPAPVKRAKPAKEEHKSVRDVPVVSGSSMYYSFCASCHGPDGRGQGPAAITLKAVPADLTVLAQDNGGKFPDHKVGEILGRRPGATAHGSEDMPVWGEVFRSHEGDANAALRIRNLIRYLEAMQR